MDDPSRQTGSGLPWYRYFWPWFMAVLLGTVVVAGISTVVIAFRNQDSLVREDWYKQGETINQRIKRDQYAASLGIQAILQLDEGAKVLRVVLVGPGYDVPESITLGLSHATQGSLDRNLELRPSSPGVYEVEAEAPVAGRWYLTVEPSANGGDLARWRLSRPITLPTTETITFGDSR